ncbi:MAG: response regulator [Thermodesulfobacteriota bacterium]
MLEVLLVSGRPEMFSDLEAVLASDREFSFQRAADGAAALDYAGRNAPHLVVADDELEDMSGLELVRRLIERNVFINTALVSSWSEPEFHEKTEGLGLLARVPPQPSPAEARALLDQLKTIVSRLTGPARAGGST